MYKKLFILYVFTFLFCISTAPLFAKEVPDYLLMPDAIPGKMDHPTYEKNPSRSYRIPIRKKWYNGSLEAYAQYSKLFKNSYGVKISQQLGNSNALAFLAMLGKNEQRYNLTWVVVS